MHTPECDVVVYCNIKSSCLCRPFVDEVGLMLESILRTFIIIIRVCKYLMAKNIPLYIFL